MRAEELEQILKSVNGASAAACNRLRHRRDFWHAEELTSNIVHLEQFK